MNASSKDKGLINYILVMIDDSRAELDSRYWSGMKKKPIADQL